MTGESFPFPGFCFNRVTDFVCFLWLTPKDNNENMYETAAETSSDDGYTAEWPASYDFQDWDFDFGNTTNSSETGYVGFDTEPGGNYYYYVDGPNDAWPEDNAQTVIPEKIIIRILYMYISPLLLLVGTIGNVTSLIIMQKLSGKVLSSCIYLCVLAVIDTIILLVRCGDDWLQEFDKIDLNNQILIFSDSTCRVYPFVFNFIFHLDRWLLVTLAIEGVLSVKYPAKVEKFCSLDRARAVILLLTVILVTVNLHYFWSFHLEKYTDTIPGFDSHKCDFPSYGNQHSEEFQEVIWPVIEILVSEILPRTVVFMCATAMAIKIIRGHHVGSKEHQAWQAKFTLDSKAIDQFKVLIMIISFLFVFLTLPKFVYLIFKYLEETTIIDIVGDSEFEPSFRTDAMIHAIASTIDNLFLSMKFFVYIAASRRFRYEFVSLFNCISCCRKISFKYQKQGGSFTQPLVRESTINSSLATTIDHLPQTIIGNDNAVQTSLITTV